MASKKWVSAVLADQILDLNAEGLPAKEIAIEAGASRATVYREIADYARLCRIFAKEAAGLFETIKAIEGLSYRLREEVMALATNRGIPERVGNGSKTRISKHRRKDQGEAAHDSSGLPSR